MNTTKLKQPQSFFKKLIKWISDRPKLLFLHFSRFFNHTTSIYAITLADVLCQRLQIYRVSVWLDDILSHRKALHSANKQASPLCNVKFGVARNVNHYGAHNKTDIGNQFRERSPNTS